MMTARKVFFERWVKGRAMLLITKSGYRIHLYGGDLVLWLNTRKGGLR